MSGRRPVLFGVTAVLTVIALVAVALQLRSSQNQSRDDLRDRFADSTANNAALTQALFGSTSGASGEELAKAFGGEISREALRRRVERGNSPYGFVVEENGGILAASGGLPSGTPERIAELPEQVEQALGLQGYGLSDAVETPEAGPVFEYVTGFDADDGSRRAFVSAIDPFVLTGFLGSYLNETRQVEGTDSYITDGNGVVIAATEDAERPLPDELAAVALEEGSGDYGDDRYRATAGLDGTSWLIISTVPNSELLASASGTHVWTPWLIFALFAGAAGVAFWMSLRALSEADELERTNQELERRARELQRSNEELEQFASIASHDLSEPLRKVQMFSKQLQVSESGRLSERGANYVERMIDASERMQQLIEDLLEFSRVTTRGRPFVAVDLGEIFADVVSDLEVPLLEAGGRVEVGSLPTIEADPLQMRQLAQNLISNAIKFRRDGIPPIIEVTGKVAGREARIEVADNGIGFDPRYETRIFRVFERLHGRTAYPGTGIGLALCRKIVERHGGKIAAESAEGEGATFTITLPVHPFRHVNGPGPPDGRHRDTLKDEEVVGAIS